MYLVQIEYFGTDNTDKMLTFKDSIYSVRVT